MHRGGPWPLPADRGLLHDVGHDGYVRQAHTSVWLGAFLAALLFGVWLATFNAAPALAHGGNDSDQASVLVLQAIGFITNKPGDMDDVNDKVNDALEAPDKEGVDIAQVQAAKDALDKGDMDQARSLLQKSLTAGAPMTGAKGEETGTTTVHDSLNTRGHLAGGDWVLLVISVLVLALGGWLSLRFQPADTVRALRRRLAPPPTGPTAGSPGGSQ
jgi:hypothetical protein